MTYNIYTYNQQLEKKTNKDKKGFFVFFFKKQTHIHTHKRKRNWDFNTKTYQKLHSKAIIKKYIFNLVTHNQNNNKKVIVI